MSEKYYRHKLSGERMRMVSNEPNNLVNRFVVVDENGVDCMTEMYVSGWETTERRVCLMKNVVEE